MQTTKAVTSATVSAVIIRACDRCGEKRDLNTPCASCGNPDAPLVHDLGVQSASYKNPLRELGWLVAGQHLAARRAEKANREIRDGNRR
jgi:hypothetical protein